MAVQIRTIMEKKLNRLLSMSKNGENSGPQKAQLAMLRRGVGKQVGELPELWGLLLEDLPEEMLSKNGVATYEEWSIYTAMTLFALHQQGQDPQSAPMHKEECSFGTAVGKLAAKDSNEERVRRRFNIVATATQRDELAHHLRGLIQLLRAEGIPLDYAELANDLYQYQFSEGQAGVRLRWGQDFYRVLYAERKDANHE